MATFCQIRNFNFIHVSAHEKKKSSLIEQLNFSYFTNSAIQLAVSSKQKACLWSRINAIEKIVKFVQNQSHRSGAYFIDFG